MKIKEAIGSLLDGQTVIRFIADDIRRVPIAMAYNVITDRHMILLHSTNSAPLTTKEADVIKGALEECLLERHVITTGIARTGNGFNTGFNLEWRVINRKNIFILSPPDRERVKAWLSRIPTPAAPAVDQPDLWGQS